MKKIALLFAFSIGLWSMLNAQWTSPGNGTTYDLDALVANSDGCVIYIGEMPYSMDRPVYRITADLTIAPTDKLLIPDYKFIEFDDVTLTIQGSMVVEGRISDPSTFFFPSNENENAHPRIRFENTTDASQFTLCVIQSFSGIQIIDSDVNFDRVRFGRFDTVHQSSAVNFMNCDPVFTNCHFYYNEGAAISSAANANGSSQILNCFFEHNVEANINQPQINLGPGAQDSIRIVNCTIDGYFNMSGGIAIADPLGFGETKILIKDNVIKNNRYGYNQQGKNLSSVIVGNQFIDNNLETNPMNGGSGISIYGMNENNKAVLRGNIITGNLWGITVINAADVDLGTENDWGQNQIHDNSNGSVVYDLYNNSTCDIMAIGNNWGTSNRQLIEAHIVHQYDDTSLGWVTFVPFIDVDGVNESASNFEISLHPVSGNSFTLTLEETMPSEMVIYNLNGQLVKSQKIENKVNTININDLKNGVYFVSIHNKGSISVKKLIVEK